MLVGRHRAQAPLVASDSDQRVRCARWRDRDRSINCARCQPVLTTGALAALADAAAPVVDAAQRLSVRIATHPYWATVPGRAPAARMALKQETWEPDPAKVRG